jgi:hypothetical protein
MSFVDRLEHLVTVKRPTAAGGIKKTYQEVTSDVPCMIQPLDPEAARRAGLAFGKAFKCFMEVDRDAREGDQLVDELAREFYVKGIRLRNYGNWPHQELLIEQDKRP